MRVGDDWARDEVELVVDDYFAMLTLELSGQSYNKAQRRRALMQRLNARSEGSIEFKRCNISAVMIQIGFPYLSGYQPRNNFQRLLMEVTCDRVQRFPSLDDAAMSAVERPAQVPDAEDFSQLRTPPPQRETRVREEEARFSVAVRRDYLERESRNRSLGQAGELFALRFERWRLMQAGRERLAERVEHVSETRGDGLGFDILSFEHDGRERFVEVKTTAFGQTTPFFVSANEARFARDNGSQYLLYRLFEFRAAPRLFELPGAIENHCRLDPSTFSASFR
jgi:hypothetical protein